MFENIHPVFVKVTNNGENIHLCFICDRMVCDKHNRNPDQRINIDLSNPESVSLIINDEGNEDGSQSPSPSDNSDTGGVPDRIRSLMRDRSDFFPSDPSVSPDYDTSSPSAPPPTYGSGYNPMIRPYANPTRAPTFEHPPLPMPMPNPRTTTNGSDLTSVNISNLPQQSDDLFPDLPPSYEVAMMDETDMC